MQPRFVMLVFSKRLWWLKMHRCYMIANIFEYAYVTPKDSAYSEIHERASDFLLPILSDPEIKIGMSSYQVGEILEVLRKVGASKNIRKNFALATQSKDKFLIRSLSYNVVLSAFQKSLESNIHIYDYLVILPVKDLIDGIYSADDHLLHKDFTSIAKVENPLDNWILVEGRRPQKRGSQT